MRERLPAAVRTPAPTRYTVWAVDAEWVDTGAEVLIVGAVEDYLPAR